ncbi:hypothetical protein ACFL02_03830 [Planctomycetota bacterium]
MPPDKAGTTGDRFANDYAITAKVIRRKHRCKWLIIVGVDAGLTEFGS